MKIRILCLLSAVILCPLALLPAAEAEIPIHAETLSGRLLFIKIGKTPVMADMAVLASDEGLIVIDAHYSPEVARRVRTEIEKRFPGRGFAYLINTHAGIDHIGGNRVFPEARLIAHENAAAQIERLEHLIKTPRFSQIIEQRIQAARDKRKTAGEASRDASMPEEAMIYWEGLKSWRSPEFTLRSPDMVFSDRLTLDAGDLTLELVHNTPSYSDSDVLLYVPEEKLLVVGDIFSRVWVPLIHEKTDIPAWVRTFERFLSGDAPVETVIAGHGGIMTLSEVADQIAYAQDLNSGLAALREAGGTLDDAKAEFAFEKRYPRLRHLEVEYPALALNLHERNIEILWAQLEKK